MSEWKVLNEDGRACHGGSGEWKLPRGKRPGAWMPAIRGVVPCVRGYHLCRDADLLGWLGPRIWLAEGRGELVVCDDKVVYSEARLLGKTAWNERVARLFACDCAERALMRAREAGREPAAESWRAVEVARRYARGAATREELSAASSAAAYYSAAAAAAAYHASSSAAAAAAYYASSAISAAWSAERAWQTERLLNYLMGRTS